MPDSAADYPEKLGPIASRVASGFGVIATDQRKRLPDDAMIGYSCLLRFEDYRANRDPELLPVVESCISKSLATDPLDSRILAAASFLSFLREEATGRAPTPSKDWNMRAAPWFGAEKMHRRISHSRDPVFSTAIAAVVKILPKGQLHSTLMSQPYKPKPAPTCSPAPILMP